MGPPPVIILQRVVAHYRLPLFKRLWEEFGWLVVTASNPPGGTELSLVESEYEFIKRFEFRFPDPRNPTRCNIPLKRILAETGAETIISEFALRMSSTYELCIRRRLRGGPATLFWSHGYNMHRGLGSWRQSMMQWPRIMLSALVDGHICYSDEGRAFLLPYISEDRLFVARNTIDVAPLQTLALSTKPIEAAGRPHLLTVSRLTRDRNVPNLVRVFKRLLVDFPDAHLTIIGGGPEAEPTKHIAGDLLGRSISMVGAEYDEARLARHYRSADLVVFCGAAGLSINHSLAYGVPVMAYDRTLHGPGHGPEIAYVVDGLTGLRVSTFTDDAMLQALTTFLKKFPDPKASFRESIARYTTENLDINVMVEDFRKVYEYFNTLRNRKNH